MFVAVFVFVFVAVFAFPSGSHSKRLVGTAKEIDPLTAIVITFLTASATTSSSAAAHSRRTRT